MPPVDEVDNATEEFGFAPHDTHNGVFDLPIERTLHANAVNGFGCSKLETLVKTFSMQHELDDFSSRVVVVYMEGEADGGVMVNRPSYYCTMKNYRQIMSD